MEGLIAWIVCQMAKLGRSHPPWSITQGCMIGVGIDRFQGVLQTSVRTSLGLPADIDIRRNR